jgi:hypothetical protein
LFTLGTYREITEVAQILRTLFSVEKVMYYFWQKNGWATIWAKFSQTLLVTLPNSEKKCTLTIE